VIDERAADRDETAPEHECAHYPQVQHLALERDGHRQRGEQQHEHQDVVHAEGLLQQVAAEVLARDVRALP